jgi:FtsP/CotA-like multicopper oxidase with cupredoxin domain
LFVLLLAGPLFHSPVRAAETKRFDLVIAERAVVSGAEDLQVNAGDRVDLVWQSDEDVTLHLHGYEIKVVVTAGEPAVMQVDAEVSGRFPISSHGFGGGHDHGARPLAYLEVYPD